MREQPHYTGLLTKEFFQKHYVEERRSYQEIRDMLLKLGYNVHVGTLYKYAKGHGIGRTHSAAKRNVMEHPLDYTKSFLSEDLIEAIDGFLLGDGTLDTSKINPFGRAKCGVEHQEFCSYLMAPFINYVPVILPAASPKSPSGRIWQGRTLYHPDLYLHASRWYRTDNWKVKQPPADVRITPRSVMMWYLGDGSIVQHGSSAALRLSTDGFSQEGVEFLAQKLRDVGVNCHRNGDNRIYVEAKGIPAFFKFIGTTSPVRCYDYKFNVPQWRLESKRMRDVAEELGLDYQRLAYMVKVGKIKAYRASDGGKPRFLPEHIEALKALVASGEFSKDNRRTTPNPAP